MRDIIGLKGRFLISCKNREGRLLWEKSIENLVTNFGKQDVLNKYFLGAAYTAGWFIGLKGEGAPAAGNTMAAHSGWTEFTGYSEATRPAYTPATATISSPSASITNSAAAAEFTFNATGTVGGLFLCSVSTKSGSTGILFNAADFAGGAEDVESGQIWNARYALTIG